MPEPGIIYLGRVPPYMKPEKMRHIFSSYGVVGRVYLQPEEEKYRKKRIKEGGSRKVRFIEGWIEFEDKKIAKAVASALNNTQIGGKKRSMYCDDLWTMKYLRNFRWSDLSGKVIYRKASAEKKARTEISQAKRENEAYMQNLDKSKALTAIVERKRKRQADADDGGSAKSASSEAAPSLAESAKAWTYKQTAPAPKRRKIQLSKVLSGGD